MDQRATRVAQDAPASPQAAAPRNGPLVWWAACSFAAILGFSRLSYGLLFPAVQRDLGGTYSGYGTLATLNFVGYLLGTLCVPLGAGPHATPSGPHDGGCTRDEWRAPRVCF